MSEIHPILSKLVSKETKETLLNQKAKCYWLYGPSGSGKTTIAIELEKKLISEGKFVIVLDGDNLRSGINAGLGFTVEDRMENTRRAAEITKILVQNGVIVIGCFICPLKSMREQAREIIGKDFVEVYVRTSLETLIQRDTKGFYKKAMEGKMENLTGINSEFEEPENADILIATERFNVIECVQIVMNA